MGSDGKPVTTSLKVAEIFGKEHKRVMQDIRELECPKEFFGHNFVLNEFDSPTGFGTRKLPMYTMTRDGLTLLAMGYNGKKAMKFKLGIE